MQNFTTVSTRPLPTMRGEALQLRHDPSGARILHIRCPDKENCFCVAVPTPPPDDTGMPHILEHMTLAGSRRFPCKEPFFEMIKRSVATFINALTGNDITYYPVCSTVKNDLFNLADVYFDAVFHPALSANTFAREAYHLAPADPAKPDGALRYDGIVYSEMKGVFSSPEGILERDSVRKLLPDTCHGKESGGNPESIPDLTLERLKEFHASRYNPSNAFIILFGDIPTEDWLAFLEPRLAPFKPMPALPPSGRQPHWSAPRSISTRYPLPQGEDASAKTYLMMNWLMGDSTDIAFSARMAILTYLLCGNDASPLSKAIDDSHAGANIIMATGLPNGLEYTWHLALDGAEPANMELFRSTVFKTLEELASRPFPKEDIEAAFQQTVYASNEIDSQYAFNTVIGAATAWCAGLDPALLIEKAPHFEKARQDVEADPMLLPGMIRKLFLDNPHRLDIVMAPSHELEDEENAELARRMEGIRSGLSSEETRAIAEKAAALEAENARPNSPEDLACLPALRLADMPDSPCETRIETIPLSGGCELLSAPDVMTNGIVYFTLSFDLRGLPAHLVPFLQPFASALEDFGTLGLNYVAAAKKRARCTGAFAAKCVARASIGPDAAVFPAMELTVKTTPSSLDEALAVAREAIFTVDPSDARRMADVIVQNHADLRSTFVENARATTRRHAARLFNGCSAFDHATGGLPLLRLAERLATADRDAACIEVAVRIAEIRDWMLANSRMTASVVAPPGIDSRVAHELERWTASMRAAAPASATAFNPSLAPRAEGLSAALQVSFAALSIPAPRICDPDSIPLLVGASLISLDYMLPEIRFKGNAYGAGLSYEAVGGTLTFTSYRDPHIAETYATMLAAGKYVKNAVWTQDAVDNAILTILKGYVQPLRPGPTCASILARRISGLTDEIRASHYRRLLALKAPEVKEAAVKALEEGLPHGAYCVAASERAISEAGIPALSCEPLIGA